MPQRESQKQAQILDTNTAAKGISEKQSKVILMGNPQVGKTSIIQSFMDNSSVRDKTVGKTDVIQDFTKIIDVKDANNDDHRLKLNIWDAAGDAAVHNLAHLFLRDAKVGILVYSIDNKASFEQLQEWVDHLKDKREELFIVIVGSKSDLSMHRAVPTIFAQRFKNQLPNCKFVCETSAYEDIQSITGLFQ